MRACQECHTKPAESGHDTCFRCRVMGVGFSFHGGVRHGRSGWNDSVRAHLEEHTGASSHKEIARTRPDLARTGDFSGPNYAQREGMT